MAKGLQGIILSIGGDLAPLAKAFKDIDKQLGTTRQELREIEKALKLDPKNTELLAQKQKLLAEQLELTKDKSAKLNTVLAELERRKGLGENVERELRAVQRECVILESSIKNTDGALSKLDTQLNTTAAQTQSFGDKLGEAGKKAADLDEKLGGKLSGGLKTMGVAAAAGGALAVKAFMDFGEEMSMVNTLLDKSVMSYADAKDMVFDISKATGKAAGEIANASYNALSAGVKTKDLYGVLATAAQTATSSSTDVGTAMDILTTIMNSYGIEASRVTEISDKLLVAQDKGKVTVGELSQGLGGLVGIASSAGISIDEVLAAIDALTMNGLPASSAMASLKTAIGGIIKPTAEAQTMAQSLGLKFNAQSLEAKGLSGMLEEVQRKTGGNTETMAKLFGSVEALNAVMILTGGGADVFTSSLESMNNATGKTDAGFKTIIEEDGEELKIALNALATSAIEVGEALTPLINALTWLFTVLSEIDPKILVLIGSLVIVATIVLQVVKVIETLSKLTGPIGTFFGGFNTAAIKTTAIVMGVVAVLIALFAIIAVIIGKGGELSSTMKDIGDSVGDVQNSVNNAGRNPPRQATGTGYHRGGGAIITEYGAEQLTLPSGSQYVVMPRGTKVDNASKTQKLLSGAGGATNNVYNVTIDAKNVREFNDVVRIASSARQSQRQGYAGR